MSDLDYDAPMPLFGRSDPSGGDGYAPGAWDEVRAAFMEGHISEPAYNTLRAALDLAQRAEADRAAIERVRALADWCEREEAQLVVWYGHQQCVSANAAMKLRAALEPKEDQ